MTNTTMTARERWRGAIAMQELDRLPFWPKLSNAYLPVRSGKFANQTLEFFHNYVGSDNFAHLPGCFDIKRRQTRHRWEDSNGSRIHYFETPLGTCRQIDQYDPASTSWHPIEMPVKTREDIPQITQFEAIFAPNLPAPSSNYPDFPENPWC